MPSLPSGSGAGHRHEAPFALQALDHLALLLGEHLGDHVVEMELLSNCFGRGAAVAGQHDDPDPGGVQERDRLGRRSLDRIGDADQAGRGAIDGDEHDGLAIGAERVGPDHEVPELDPQVVE